MPEGSGTPRSDAGPTVPGGGTGHRVAACLRAHRVLFTLTGLGLVLIVANDLLVDAEGVAHWAVDVAVVIGLIAVILVLESRHDARLRATSRTIEDGERRFRELAEQGADISFRYRVDPRGFEYLSPSWERVTGMPVATALADRDLTLRLISSEDLPALGRIMTEGTPPGQPQVLHVLRADGGSRFAEFQTTIVRDARGRHTHTIGTARDVTERVIAEGARRISDERYRLLADQSQDIVFEWRHQPTPAFGYLSPSFERITGYTTQEAREGAIDPLTLVRTEDLPQLDRALRLGTPPDAPIRFRIRRRDTQERTVELVATLLTDPDGGPARVVGSARDITERVETEARLRASEQRFREMTDRSRDIIFRYQLRPSAGFAFISQSVGRLVSGGAESFLGDPSVLDRTVHPDDRYLLASLLTSTVPSDDPVTIRWLGGQGEVAWTEVTIVPLLGPDGLPDAIDGVARIVTDRVLAQQALARSEERFRLLAERSRDVILRYRVHPEPGLEYVSPSIEQLTGYSQAALLEHPEFALAHFGPDDLATLYRVMAQGTPPGEPAIVRWTPPGRPAATWEVTGVPVHDRNGTVVATECVARDISIRAAALRALERSEARFREMLTNLQLLAIIVDAEGRCAFANAAAARLAGATPEALVGQDLVHLLAPAEFVTQARAYLAMLLAGMPSDRRDLIVTAADGTTHTLVWDPIVLHDDEGRPSAIAAIGEDVTEARRAAADRDRLMAVTERSEDAVAIVDPDGSIGYANPAMLARLGADSGPVVGTSAAELLPERLGIPWPMPAADSTGIWKAERRVPTTDPDAPDPVEELMVSPIVADDGSVSHHVVEVWDVSRVRELEWAVDHAARARSVVFAALQQLDAASSPEATAGAIVRELRGLPGVDAAAILAFDLPAGGHVLAASGIAGMRAGSEAPIEAVAYLRDQLAAGPFAERWTERHPHSTLEADGRHVVAASVGPLLSEGRLVGLLLLTSADPEQVRRFAADLSTVAELSAMTSVLLGPAIRDAQAAATTRHQLRRVIDESRFEVRYQPIVDLATGGHLGYEATTRFLDDLEPAATLASAASVGLALPLETAMLRAALELARDLPSDAWLALNLTPGLLVGLDSLRTLLDGCGRRVVLELSEHLLIGDYAPLREALALLGPAVELAIDDTGAGQANLAHLVELSAAYVKLDGSLVRGVDGDSTRQAMARGILQFAAATGSAVIAEGVETQAELDALQRLGVTLAQGHLLGRPEPASAWARSVSRGSPA